jgi:transcriptional regulator with XRE-family HTH domain
MQSENLTASRLAEILEIKPAAISHILSGRNKPSFDLLCKIVNRFPQINPYWLLGDAEEMRNQNAPFSTSEQSSETSATLFDLREQKSVPVKNSDTTTPTENLALPTFGRSDIEKIIVVYSDRTFEELKPKKLG